MHPTDIAAIAILVVAALAVLWLVANSRRGSSGTADFIATWLAMSLLVFIVGGGLAMFGVVVLLFVLGQQAAFAGLVLLAIGLILEPFVVAAVLYRRRSRKTRG